MLTWMLNAHAQLKLMFGHQNATQEIISCPARPSTYLIAVESKLQGHLLARKHLIHWLWMQ